MRRMPLLRVRTYDAAIWSSVGYEYPDLPASFAPGETLLDVGGHTGAVSRFAAERGATVVCYEANFENYLLASLNLQGLEAVTVHHRAVWRSDLDEPGHLLFAPSAAAENTGGGSVMFSRQEDHWRARPREQPSDDDREHLLSAHAVGAVSLDEILALLGPVRVLKIDVEGAEFPILLTARRLELVELIIGEYHEFDDASMALLAVGARVGTEPYSGGLLRRHLEHSGFDVEMTPRTNGQGYFKALRRARAG